MNKFKTYYQSDCYRMMGGGYTHLLIKLLRRAQFTVNPLGKKIYQTMYKMVSFNCGVEIPSSTKIGEGFSIYHPFNITVNPDTTIGKNCDIHKGVLIGEENRGPRKGCPQIGNCVWIGPNAVIVGKIKIGDDVMIAPNSFVNCDVPSHSIVFGNPCVIKHAEKATENYINRIV